MKKKQETISSLIPTDYRCPICDQPLYRQWGNQMFTGNKDHGVTLFCKGGDSNGRAHPQEVAGHANGRRSDESMMKYAYGVIMSKFRGTKMELQEDDVEPAVHVDIKPTPEPKQSEPIRKGKVKAAKVNPPVVDAEDDAL